MGSLAAAVGRRCVLVTSFGPFGCYTHNPSQDVVDALAADQQLQRQLALTGKELVTEKLPVSYEHVDNAVPQLWSKYQPQLVVHVGVDGSRQCVNVEQQAPNVGYVRRDVDGRVPLGNRCSLSACACGSLAAALDVQLLVRRVNEALAHSQSPQQQNDRRLLRPSDAIGSYLCAYSYYTSLAIDPHRCLFVHIPVPDQIVTVEFIATALKHVVLFSLEHIEDTST